MNSLGHAHPALVGAVTDAAADARPRLELLRHRAAGRASPRSCSSLLASDRRQPGQGLLRQLRRRGQRGRPQADPAHRPHPRRRDRGRLPRPHHGRARADLQGGLPRAVRAAARRRHVRAVRRRRRARRRRHRRDRRRGARAAAGRGRRGRAAARLPRRAPARSPASTAPCSGSTRSRPASGAPARGSPTRTRPWPTRWTHPPTSSPSPRASPAASRSAPASPPVTAADLLQPGNHGTTFGGNPVAAAAALAVIDTIEKDGLLEHVTEVGQRLRDGLAADDRVTEVRGSGLLIGLDLTEAGVGRGVRRRARGGVHRQQPDPRAGPARAAAGPHRRRRPTRSSPRGRTSSTRRTQRGVSHDPPLPARRRPLPGAAGGGARPRR